MVNCFQLTILAIIISLIDASRTEILSQDAMTCTKLKLAKDMTRHTTHEILQWIRIISYIQLPLDNRVVKPIRPIVLVYLCRVVCYLLIADAFNVISGNL